MQESSVKRPSVVYQQAVDSGSISADPAQLALLPLFDQLQQQLLCAQQQGQTPWGKIRSIFTQPTPVQGLYLWGTVGRGKTFLMDTLFAALPFTKKKRLHFYRFMQWVHTELQGAQQQQRKDPLRKIAQNFAKQTRVLCFDEFYVSDVTDAMIMAELLTQLFACGVTLIATSNTEPDKLYANGVHRDRFLPAIAQIKRYTQVVSLPGQCDYRLRLLEQADIYYTPADSQAEQALQQAYQRLAVDESQAKATLSLNGRELQTVAASPEVLWCHYQHLCGQARSQYDYIELAKEFHAVILSAVPQFKAANDDQARRFISMVDEFYDRNVKLIVSAEVAIDELYVGSLLQFEFQRTRSRLIEMQSHHYLAQPHNP